MQDLELIALLCSKLCHDLVGPVSALGNGVEILDEEDDPEMRKQALELLSHSAELAANRLKFLRLAFGAAGGEGVPISLAEARMTARDFISEGRGELDWPLPDDGSGPALDKTSVKLLLNLILVANDAIPRGGQVRVTLAESTEGVDATVSAEGPAARVADGVEVAFDPDGAASQLNPRSAPARLATRLAQSIGRSITVSPGVEQVALSVELQSA